MNNKSKKKMSYKYVDVTLTKQCAMSLWTLTLSKNEWGGQLFPAIQNDKCVLTCDQKLIEGTGFEENEDDRYYLGGEDDDSHVMIAVTPFYEEVFQVHPLCNSEDTINIFFHSHPLFMMKSPIGMLSPPSLGDFFAHTLLSNYRNYRQNGQLNTAMVAAFEGLYVYFAMPHRFMQFKDRVEELWKSLPNKTKQEREDFKIGELSDRLIEKLKMETFNSLRSCFDDFMHEFAEMASRKDLSIKDAPVLQDSKWSCKGCGPEPESLEFPYHDFVQSKRVRAFVRNNSYLNGLHEHGFHYEFFPIPLEQNVIFLALSKLNDHSDVLKQDAPKGLLTRPESP